MDDVVRLKEALALLLDLPIEPTDLMQVKCLHFHPGGYRQDQVHFTQLHRIRVPVMPG
jgi:hypothetical protein